MSIIKITILKKDNCKFCDFAKEIINRLSTEYPLSVETEDLNSPNGIALAQNAGFLFPPGILINDDPFSYGRLSEKQLRREIERMLAN